MTGCSKTMAHLGGVGFHQIAFLTMAKSEQNLSDTVHVRAQQILWNGHVK